MSNFKQLSAYKDVPCEWVSSSATRNDKLDQLEAENAKLRELCGELAGELHARGVDFNRFGWCFLRDELRELGIEVDG